MDINTFIPKPPKTGNKYIDAILGLATNFVPGQAELGLYNSAKDAYSDYQKGDYKSLGKKAATELALNLVPYGVGKAAKPVIKAVKKRVKNINPNQILDGIGPRALKTTAHSKEVLMRLALKILKRLVLLDQSRVE